MQPGKHEVLTTGDSFQRLLQLKIDDGGDAPEGDWICFCCTKRNGPEIDHCCVCARPKSYVSKREILPLHGVGGHFFRKSQLKTLFRDEGDIIETDDKQVQFVVVICFSCQIHFDPFIVPS